MTDPGMLAVVMACQKLREAQDALAEAVTETAQALLEWSHTAAVSPAEASAAVRAALLDAGWTQSQVDRVGVSEDGVLARRRDEPRSASLRDFLRKPFASQRGAPTSFPCEGEGSTT